MTRKRSKASGPVASDFGASRALHQTLYWFGQCSDKDEQRALEAMMRKRTYKRLIQVMEMDMDMIRAVNNELRRKVNQQQDDIRKLTAALTVERNKAKQ